MQRTVSSPTLDAVIGSGRDGTVVSATIASPDGLVEVAIKRPHRSEDGRREAALLRRFAHPHVVRIASSMRDGSFVLERLDSTLAHHADAPMPVAVVATVIDQLSAALAPIHEAGWIHGDVSPSNVGLRSDGSIALMDFGAAVPADGAALAGGTSAAVGSLVTATHQVDVRAVAALASYFLGETPRHDRRGDLRNELDDVLARIDSGVDASLSDVANVFVDVPRSPILVAGPTTGSTGPTTGGSPPGRPGSWGPTRDFGPGRPTHVVDREHRRIPRAGVAAVVIGALALVGALIETNRATSAHDRAEDSPATLHTPTDTLEAHGVDFDAESGVVTVLGSGEQFLLAERGDVVAVGDWNCDGTVTPGVWSPGSGEWFAFADWEPGNTTTGRPLGRSGVLRIEVDLAGCAAPDLHPLGEQLTADG